MTETPVRIFAGFGILVLLWIGVYWWWEPADGRITFADVDPSPVAPPEGTSRPSEARPAIRRVIPPSFVEYTVSAGDKSLAEISRKFYHSPDHWRAIARANPLMDPERIRAGRVIRVPVDPGNIQGKVERATPPDGATAGPLTPVEYIVLDGDTLSTISQQFYGTTRQAKFVFEHNRERLKLRSMDSIRAGQTLVIPPLTGEGR